MAMSMGSAGGSMADINVTPMIDILLVLLIIFMVIVPQVPDGLNAAVPQPPKNPQKQQQNDHTIVVQVLYRPGAQPAYKINQDDVSFQELLPKLTAIYANRAERVMFVRGDDNVDFQYVANVIDLGKEANVDHVGLLTPKIQQGQ
ncbi:MAG TPA: biopolymer transporter ExbD [Terracidiphilus sp.]|nr:biopolymer transporter ExbD [Terracidiphilus sp.]